MLQEEAFEKDLARALKLLDRDEPVTAPELAKLMRCSTAAAFRRLAELRRRHKRLIKVVMVRRGARGSESKAYMLRRGDR